MSHHGFLRVAAAVPELRVADCSFNADRTLDLLVKSGLVRRVHLGEDHYHYERVTKGSHHDHLVCTTCGAVIEFHDARLEELQNEICRRKKFVPTFHNLQILGICGACQKKGEHPDAPDRVQMIQETATALRRGIPHPCLDKALRLQTIEGRIQRSERAPPAGCLLDRLPNRNTVGIFAQTRCGGEHQILELSEPH